MFHIQSISCKQRVDLLELSNDITASPVSSSQAHNVGLSLPYILERNPLWRFDIEKERLNNINCWELN